MEINKVRLADKFKLIEEYWTPAIVGKLNRQCVKIARIKGDFVWHKHDDEDELFYVIKGELEIALENKLISLGEGEFVIIPKGVLHKPKAREEVELLLFEPESTVNTGDVSSEFTKVNLKSI